MASTINATGHGLTTGDAFRLINVDPPDCGIDQERIYYVLGSNLTTDSFEFSETDGGAAVTLAYDIASADIISPDTYAEVSDGVQDAPTEPATPYSVSVASITTSGLARWKIVVPAYADAATRIRLTEVQYTHAYASDVVDPGPPAVYGDPYIDWSKAQVLNFPPGATELTIPAAPLTGYAFRSRVQDVYGYYSDWSLIVEETSAAGSDALAAAMADLANDVQDGIITETKIGPEAVTTPKIKSQAITADLLAATLVLASTIMTSETGRRVEIDEFGIRLVDADDELIVNIPTSEDQPVYFKGDVVADTLTATVANNLSGVVALSGDGVMTLANGVSAPTIPPTLAASVDFLTLATTPSGVTTAAGIAYDSAAGTFWLACDPTVSPNYVAQEFNATTGALVRSISATGSTTTYTTTLGSTSHVSDTWESTSVAAKSQVATPLTMPRDGTITKVAGYVAGYGGGVSLKMGLWSSGGTLRRHSAAFTAAERAFSSGNDTLYNKSLSSGYAVSSGTTVLAGWCRTTTGQTMWWTRDDGTGKTTKFGNNYDDGDMESITTVTTTKPNIYVTYTYDVDTRLETAPNVGIATDGTYVYTLDNTGVIWKYARSDGSYVSKSSVQTGITGTKSKAGLFYDATATELIITTTTGTGTGVYPRFVRVAPSTLAVSTAFYDASAGTTFNGATDTFRGGARLADPLNSSAATYWLATTSAVYAYTFSGTAATQTADRDFAQATTAGDGLTHDGTRFRGWDSASPTKVWKFTNWDWTTASAVYWVGYSWYDSNASGDYHETDLGPRSSVTMRRRQRLYVANPTVPSGGADDPDKVRIYMKPNATEPAATGYWLQETDALTARYLTTYTGSGTADGSVAAFSAGTPAEIKSSATGWSLKGDGSVSIGAAIPIGGKPPVRRVYTSNNTWTRPAGLSHIEVEVVGAGGGGGGVDDTSASEAATGAGGGGGGYAKKLLTAADLSAISVDTEDGVSVVVGGGGSGGSTAGGDGGTGALSKFDLATTYGGTAVLANPGTGGGGDTGSTGFSRQTGGAGGSASGGDINVNGGPGHVGMVAANTGTSTVPATVNSGVGGTSVYGSGGRPGNTGSGGAGTGYGGGGAGATIGTNTSPGRTGGAGADGVVIITEYYGA